MAGAHDADAPSAPSSVAVGGRRLPKGERDRFGIAREGCAKCAAHASGSRGGGVLILFYAYVRVSDPSALAARLRAACASAGVTGKIRVAAEGINGTAAGPAVGVESLIGHITNDTHEPELASGSRSIDWKRQRGCAHLFADVSVRVVPEIVPFDDPARTIDPNASGALKLERLDPVAFHAEAARAASALRSERGASSERSSTVLLDVRNWYESRLGYFAGAVRAPIRRFSQLKEWLEMDPFRFKDKRVLAYCTGGVRCEKACAFLASLDEDRRPSSVAQLRGGVAAYARDVAGCAEAIENVKRTSDTSITDVPREATEESDRRANASRERRDVAVSPKKNERKKNEKNEKNKSLFLGSNFVFDARGATKVTDDVCGRCDGCGRRTDRVDACKSEGCHTLLLVCKSCAERETFETDARTPRGVGSEETDETTKRATPVARLNTHRHRATGVFCCASCAAQDAERFSGATKKRRRPCDCDGYAARESRLEDLRDETTPNE